MDEAIATQAVLLLFGGALLGACLGAATSFLLRRRSRRDAFMPGMAVGLLVFGITTSLAAGRLGWSAWQFEAGTVEVVGRLIGHEERIDTDAQGRRTRSLAPRVAYQGPDGRPYTVLGLGGSQGDRAEGDTVPVRYRLDAPQRAVIDDFQNRWGAFWGFSGFAGFGLLAGLFFAISAWSDGPTRLARPRDRGPRSRALGRLLNAAAATTLIASIVAPLLAPSQDIERSLAMSFAGVAVASLIYAPALWLSPQGERRQSLMILLIVAAGFGFFAFGLWQMS